MSSRASIRRKQGASAITRNSLLLNSRRLATKFMFGVRETKEQRSEVRSQKSKWQRAKIREQRSENRDQRSEVGNGEGPGPKGEGAKGEGVTVHRELGRFAPADLSRTGRRLDQFPAPRRLLVQ